MIGSEIKRLRTVLGLSQTALAEQIRVNQSFVAKLETGERTGIGADTLYLLCDALNVPCDHFRSFLAVDPAEINEMSERPSGKRK